MPRITHPATTIVLPTATAAVFVIAWWALTAVADIPSFFLPAPADVLDSARQYTGYLGAQTWTTLQEILAGYTLAVVTGVATAVVLGTWRPVEHAVMPTLVALNAVPKVAVAPLLVLWLGFGASPKITLVWVICVFPIVLGTLAGLRSTPVELVELGRSLDAGWWPMLVKIRLLWALPQAFTGLKLAVQLAVIGAVVAEVTNPNAGLGAVVVTSSANADTPLAFTAITLLALLNVALFYLLAGVERLLLPWARATTG